MQYRGPPGYPVLQAATSRQLERPSPRVDDGGRLSASHTTARATATAAGRSADGADRRPSRPGGAAATAGPARATAAGWSAAKIVTVPGIWLRSGMPSRTQVPIAGDQARQYPGHRGTKSVTTVRSGGQMTRSAVLTHKALLRRAGPRGLIGIAAMTGASMTSPLRTPC